jgi:hypothetical protein
MVNEGYLGYRKLTEATPKQKIGNALKVLKKKINEIDRIVKYSNKLKYELGDNGKAYFNSTNKTLEGIKSKLKTIYKGLKDMDPEVEKVDEAKIIKNDQEIFISKNKHKFPLSKAAEFFQLRKEHLPNRTMEQIFDDFYISKEHRILIKKYLKNMNPEVEKVDEVKIVKKLQIKVPKGFKSIKPTDDDNETYEGFVLGRWEAPMEGWDEEHEDIIVLLLKNNKYYIDGYFSFGDFSRKGPYFSQEDAVKELINLMKDIKEDWDNDDY